MVGMPTNLSIQTILGDVVGSTGHRYAVTDSAGNTTDTVKIITNPAGGYLGVYHTGSRVNLATSTDLLSWVFRRTLDTQATQPTICALPLSLPPGQTTRGGVTGPGVRRSAGTICLGSDGLDRPRPHRDQRRWSTRTATTPASQQFRTIRPTSPTEHRRYEWSRT
jgi:hypothetical protein